MEPGRRIAAARALERISQEELAHRLTELSGEEWTRGNVASIENGRRGMRVTELELFAEAQGQDIAWYLSGSRVSPPYRTFSPETGPLDVVGAS